LAALQGNVDQIRKIIDSGKVHVDCKDKVMFSFESSQLFKYGIVTIFHRDVDSLVYNTLNTSAQRCIATSKFEPTIFQLISENPTTRPSGLTASDNGALNSIS